MQALAINTLPFTRLFVVHHCHRCISYNSHGLNVGYRYEPYSGQGMTAINRFMETNFQKVTPVCTNLFSDKNGDPLVNGFVQVVGSKCVKRIMDEITSKNLKLCDFNDVKIKRAKAAVDRNRDWALYRAEELIKKHSAAVGKAVVRERGSDSRVRGVYVDGVRAFEQSSRYCKDGVFLQAFAALSLR